MKYSFLAFLTCLMIACGSNNNQENDTTTVVNDEIKTSETVSKPEPKIEEPFDTLYIADKEPDISTGITDLPFEPDFAYIANNQLFIGEKENLSSKKIPISGELVSFSCSPNNKQHLYVALKTEVNETAKKVIEKFSDEGLDIEGYDLKIYKLDLNQPDSATYITTLYDRTNEPDPDMDNYFAIYGTHHFKTNCLGDTLILYCEPIDLEGSLNSRYVISLRDRKTICNNLALDFPCTFPKWEECLSEKQLDFKFTEDNLKVFYKEEGKEDRLILNHNSWKSLFKNDLDIIERITTSNDYSWFFDFSISPDGNQIAYAVYTEQDMGQRTGATYIYNQENSISTMINRKIILGSVSVEHRWLPNNNILLYSSDPKYKKLLLVNTNTNKVDEINQVSTFQVFPF